MSELEQKFKTTNYERLVENIQQQHKPFIIYDVETTGVMDGNDNRITQIALASYSYNEQKEQYELQDKMFLLAKGDKTALEKIEENQIINEINVRRAIFNDYKYSIVKEIKSLEKKLINCTDEVREDHFKGEISRLKDVYEYLDKTAISFGMMEEMQKTERNPLTLAIFTEALNYLKAHWDEKVDEMTKAETIGSRLMRQGINFEVYKEGNEGLTSAEMNIGISNFLKKYMTNDTVFINNGTYFSHHYLDKEGIQIADKDAIEIDMTQAQRSMNGGKSSWTTDIEKFAENYKNATGKEIQTFDAFTKALCIGEIAMQATDLKLVNNSEHYLQSMLKEEAMSKDDGYVLSKDSVLTWVPDHNTFTNADFIFNNLEYVDFGNDRRYVDLDSMFTINGNFEVTLEGEKTPIKTWEELEAKIKALNSEISKELLDKIHDKFMEISDRAVEQKAEKESAVQTVQKVDVEYEEGLSGLYLSKSVIDAELEVEEKKSVAEDTENGIEEETVEDIKEDVDLPKAVEPIKITEKETFEEALRINNERFNEMLEKLQAKKSMGDNVTRQIANKKEKLIMLLDERVAPVLKSIADMYGKLKELGIQDYKDEKGYAHSTQFSFTVKSNDKIYTMNFPGIEADTSNAEHKKVGEGCNIYIYTITPEGYEHGNNNFSLENCCYTPHELKDDIDIDIALAVLKNADKIHEKVTNTLISYLNQYYLKVAKETQAKVTQNMELNDALYELEEDDYER